MAVAALILGIVGLLIDIISVGILGWLGALISIVGIVLGALAMKNNPEKKSLAVAGLVLSIIGAAIGLIVFLACSACVGSSISAGNSILDLAK